MSGAAFVRELDFLAVVFAAMFVWVPLAAEPAWKLLMTYYNQGRWQGLEPTAIIGILTLGVSAIQAWILSRQTGIIDKQATLTHQTYLATHHPRLHVSGILLDGTFSVWIYVRNKGPNDAKNVRFDAVFALERGSNRVAPWTEDLRPNQHLGPVMIERGETRTYTTSSNQNLSIADHMAAERAQATITIIGRITYQDDMDVLRNTGFGWKYDPRQKRFIRAENEDEYNYED
jgi:hypothetical protein